MQSYAGFITFLRDNTIIRPLKDHYRRGKRTVCLLRHDVTDDLDRAIELATIENSLGVSGTYFVIPSDDLDIKKVKRIIELGHEIGFHNNILDKCFCNRRVGYAQRLFDEGVRYFQDNKIRIYGVSPCYSESCSKYNVTNSDIFKEFRKRGKPDCIRHTNLFTISLKKSWLYETEYVLSDYRFNDYGGQWNGGKLEGVGVYPFIHNIATTTNSVIQVVIHPKEWDV